MQRPPDYPENEPPEDETLDDDLVNKVYGPSQDDIDRSWEGYETGRSVGGKSMTGIVWKAAIVVVSLVILASMSLGVLSPLFGGSDSPQERAPERITATVLRVIDGRTIVINSGDGEQTVVRQSVLRFRGRGDAELDRRKNRIAGGRSARF